MNGRSAPSRRRRGAGLWSAGFLAAGLLAFSPAVSADAVDESFALGNAAAAQGDWTTAIEHYEQARTLLPGRSAVLSYNLGTAYGRVDDVGRAVFHLQRALQSEAEPSDEIVEAARRNLLILQRRAELDAAATGAQISKPEGWWDRFIGALALPAVGWVSLIGGWGALLLLSIRTWVARRGGTAHARALLGGVTLVLGLVFIVGALVHGFALQIARSAPRAIALEEKLEVREGPGGHRKVSFVLQAGSRVRVIDDSPGWSKMRLSGGLEGWVPERLIGHLDAPPAATAAGSVGPAQAE